MSDRAIRSVVVLGGGIVGLSAAAAFARALPTVSVTLIETPPDPAALADRLPGSTPAIAHFHRLIGLEEAELIATGAATWRIGTRFRNWSASGLDWIHFNGDCGPRIGTIGFHHLWARAARAGEALPYHAYSAAGVLAQADKFVLPVDDASSPFASYDYALRLVPGRYRDLLSRHCCRLGVARLDGELGGAEADASGAVAALLLQDGRRIAGDLYVDCSGPSAPLLACVRSDFEDWSMWLPACRVGIEADKGEAGAVDEIERTPTGWRWTAPGAGSGAVVAADQDSEGTIVVRPGRLRTPWRRNVVAIGDAAAQFDPLGWASLRFAHLGIELALALLPDCDFHGVELAEYNRRAAETALAMRDFAALFYRCPNGPEGSFWQDAAALELPEALEDALRQFRRNGYVTPAEEEGARDSGWLAALTGLGYLPEHAEALASAIQPAAAMARWADGLAAIAHQLPPYRDYLANTLQRLRGKQ